MNRVFIVELGEAEEVAQASGQTLTMADGGANDKEKPSRPGLAARRGPGTGRARSRWRARGPWAREESTKAQQRQQQQKCGGSRMVGEHGGAHPVARSSGSSRAAEHRKDGREGQDPARES